MKSSPEFQHFWKFINAVDLLDARKNEVMVWIADDGKFEVDFSIHGKAATARMYAEENERCSIALFDELHQNDGEIIITCETQEEYIEQAKRVIAYLHRPHDVC